MCDEHELTGVTLMTVPFIVIYFNFKRYCFTVTLLFNIISEMMKCTIDHHYAKLLTITLQSSIL